MPVTPAIALPVSMERTRPLPIRWTEDIEHLDGATRGELRIPRCTSCGREFWPAGPVCPFDFSADVDWVTDPVTASSTPGSASTGPTLTATTCPTSSCRSSSPPVRG